MRTALVHINGASLTDGWTRPPSLVYGALMLDPKLLDDLTRRLTDAMPPAAKAMRADVEKNLRATVQAALAKLDLVTREEFDVQTKVLARTRARIEQLEKQLAALEKPGTPNS